MSNLTLYVSPTCHYCLRVKDFMAQNKITLSEKNVLEGNNRAELAKIGGKTQVPCLVIDGKALYESLDIIDWLKKNWKKS